MEHTPPESLPQQQVQADGQTPAAAQHQLAAQRSQQGTDDSHQQQQQPGQHPGSQAASPQPAGQPLQQPCPQVPALFKAACVQLHDRFAPHYSLRCCRLPVT